MKQNTMAALTLIMLGIFLMVITNTLETVAHTKIFFSPLASGLALACGIVLLTQNHRHF